jgi:hypothetical protein
VDESLLEEMTALADAHKAEKWRTAISSTAPTPEELKQAIARLQTGKAPGVEGYPAELLQFGSEVLIPHLSTLCTYVWEQGTFPSDWAASEILPRLKRGKPSDQIASYRPISLVSMTCKVLMLVVQARLAPMVEDTVGDYQHGFRRARSTTDAIFTYRLLCEKYRQTQGGHLHTCFIDLTQAFDRVSWDILWHALRISGAPEPILTLICALYAQAEVHIRTERSEDDPGTFRPTAGVRQGCVLSPTLFILMFDYIIRVAMQGVDRFPERTRWPVLGGSLLTLLGYADDLALTARDMVALSNRMRQFDEACARAGMCISTKTKLMHVNTKLASGSTSTTRPSPPLLQLSSFFVDPVEHFTYLGSDINSNLDLTSTIHDRLSKAGAAFAMLSRIWTASHLSASIKAQMYLSLVRPIALYGAETWTLLPSMEHLVDVTEMRWLRQLVRVSRQQELTNREIRRRARCPTSLSEACRQARLRYYGHLCRQTADRAPNVAVHGAAPGQRRPGRPPTSWLDLLDMDAASRAMTRADLQRLAQDREAYRLQVVHARPVEQPAGNHAAQEDRL